MSDTKNSSKPTVVSETKKALQSAVDTQLQHAVITSDGQGRFKIDASLAGTAKDAAKAAVISTAQRKLCDAGYAVNLTCDSNAPGNAYYYFDFSTDKGKERVVVGVTMDNDRAEYLVKQAGSIGQNLFSKAKGLFD